MKSLILFLILTIMSLNIATPVFAKKELINVTPVKKITTAHDTVTEGDYVDFKIVNTDKIIRGLVVKYEPNGWLGKEASLVIDQFQALNSNEKFDGTISLNGNQHNDIMEFFTWIDLWVRGGEVTILPDKDIFGLWREE